MFTDRPGDILLKRIAEELGFPLVIKLRVTSVGRGMALVTDFQELVEKTRLASVGRGTPMIQEYVPGRHIQVLRLIYDKKGHLKVASCPIQLRDFPRITLNMRSFRLWSGHPQDVVVDVVAELKVNTAASWL